MKKKITIAVTFIISIWIDKILVTLGTIHSAYVEKVYHMLRVDPGYVEVACHVE